MAWRTKLLAHSFVLIIAWAILRDLLGLLYLGYFGNDFVLSPTFPFFAYSLLWVLFGLFGIVYLGLFRLGKVDRRRLGWTRAKLGRSVLFGLAGWLLVLTLEAGLNSISITGLGVARTVTLWPVNPNKLLLALFWGFAIAAPIEQSLYAGYLQPILAEKLGLPSAIILQAAVFSVAHLGWLEFTVWPQFAVAFVVGLVFGIQRGKDRSLVASSLTHGLSWIPAALIT